jgi:hypothetical protein
MGKQLHPANRFLYLAVATSSVRPSGLSHGDTSCCNGELFNQEEQFQKQLITCFNLVLMLIE